MKIGSREFDTEHHTYIMGILNVTPDSFSDGGMYNDLDKALLHAQELVRDGADILDVGGESTRPGHIQITEDEETERVVPVIERLKQEFDTPISIDTYKSSVAKAAVQAGAALVNDIWGLKYDAGMADVIAESQTACCLMHNREKAEYVNFLPEVLMDLENIKELNRLKFLEYPILLGTSRKSVIGLTLDLPASQREEGTLVTTVLGILRGCSFVRVHDVKGNKRAIQMTEAIMREHDCKGV